MQSLEYFDEIVVGVLATFVLLLLGQIFLYFKNVKSSRNSQVIKGHIPHWIFSLTLLILLLLEFMERVMVMTTADHQGHDVLRLSSCLLSALLVFLSLASYYVSEKRLKRLNIIGLLCLWVFLCAIYLVKAAEKTYVSSWHNCPLQMRQMVEIFIAANSFMLFAIDAAAFGAMGLKKTGLLNPGLEGVEFVHEYCCFLSKVTYHWVNKMLLKGFKRPIEQEDLGTPPKTEDVEIYYQALKTAIENEKVSSLEKKRDFSMWKCIWNVSKSTIIFTGMLQFTAEMMLFIAPMCLDRIIDSLDHNHTSSNSTHSESNVTTVSLPTQSDSFFDNPSTPYGKLEVCPLSVRSFFGNPYVLSTMLLVSYLVQVPVKKYHDFLAVREGIRLKSAIQACIFDKSLSLKMSFVNEGKFTNHMAVDATQLVNFSYSCHYVWSIPILVISCLLLLFFQLGKTGAMGCLLVFILVPVQYLLGRYLGQRQDQIMDTADKRLLKTNEMLEHIKLLKMYGWEDLFCQRVVNIRSKEISTMWKTSIARVLAAFITDGIPSFACMFTFILYYFMESTPLKLSKVFSSIVIFMILANQLFFVAYIIVGTIKTRTSMRRLRDYFVLPQIFQKDSEEEMSDLLMDRKTEKRNLLKNSDNKKKNNKSNNGLQAVENIQMSHVSENTNNAAVEGGDDTSDLIDELAVVEGVVKITEGTFAWHQNPVLNDINLTLQKGKLTMMLGSVGSGKSSLLWAILGEMELQKGTQEFCELPLALVPQRAWIMNASIRDNITFGRPFDDQLYNEVITSCTLDTDFKLFPDGDATEIGEKGANLSGGQKQRVGLARALYQNADVYLLDDCLSALDPQVAATIFDKVVLKRLMKRGKTAFFVTHNTNLLKHADNIVIMTSGNILYQGHPNLCPAPIISHLRADLEQDSQHSKDHASDKLTKVQPSSVLPDKFRISSLSSTSLNFVKQESESDPPRETGVAKLVTDEERQMGATPFYFTLQYLKHAGLHLVIAAFILYGFRQGFKILGDYYLGVFIENSDIGRLDVPYLIWFCVSTCASIFLIPVSVLAVEKFCLNASKNIHNKIIHSLAAAPMRFFDTTPLGRILNRMSADHNIMDLVLNAHFDCFLFLLTFVIGSVFVNGCFNPFFLVPAIPILILSVLLQRFFIASCRELQRLDCITKSRILSHFSQILSGLHIIRTSGCEERFKKENFEHVNRNNLPLLFQYVCTSWMAYRLDLLGAGIVFISFISCLIAHSKGYMDANAAGVAMLYAVCNSYFLHWAMKYLSDLEIYTSNIQRLVEFCDLKSEGDNEDKKPHPPPEWPTTGDLQFRDVSLTYDKSLQPVVQDLDLNFPSGYKVGVCGRTGSGKSTLTLGIFRLVDICKGEILLDHLDISSVPIKDLRNRLSIIPQDPVIFAGNIRFNLDPLGLKTDEDLWSALEVSQLHELVYNLPQKLETEISSGGCSLSIGEKQLLCLARALLRNSKVLVMDEATASIDQRTDQVIQNIIKSAFKDRTVLTVAHRISTIIHSDWVVVMQGGQLIEEGSPQELLKKNTNFASMVNSS